LAHDAVDLEEQEGILADELSGEVFKFIGVHAERHA
jgi:hypothetical protein